jgi:hypothetical protein
VLFEEGTMNEDFIPKALSGIDMGQEGILQMSGRRMARLTGPFASGAAPSRRELGVILLLAGTMIHRRKIRPMA